MKRVISQITVLNVPDRSRYFNTIFSEWTVVKKRLSFGLYVNSAIACNPVLELQFEYCYLRYVELLHNMDGHIKHVYAHYNKTDILIRFKKCYMLMIQIVKNSLTIFIVEARLRHLESMRESRTNARHIFSAQYIYFKYISK